MIGTTPECAMYIGGHPEGYYGECYYCVRARGGSTLGKLTSVSKPADEARRASYVDQGQALVRDALTTYLAQYRRRIDAGVSTADALLYLTQAIYDDAQHGARGMEGLASLAAVAIVQLADRGVYPDELAALQGILAATNTEEPPRDT